jgi:putative Mg2+ transporter-C (MgtC) family protein
MIVNPIEYDIEMTLRLLAAACCGVAIGFNRDLKRKPAGMRTLGLVALGACLASIAGLQDQMLRENADALSRVVQGVLQGVMTGVGFIGAGVILKLPNESVVRGLTTAATVWLTAALGIACALADWRLIVAGLAIALLVLIVPHRLAKALGSGIDDDDGGD